jgi:hypothetical protein
MPTYAQIDDDNLLIGISHLSGEVDYAHMILVEGAPPLLGSTLTENGWAPPAAIPGPTFMDVDAERDRRIAAGFTFGGTFFQSRPEDRENIMGAGTAALGAMMLGAQAGDYRWHGGDSDFMWIAADNSTHPMDAQTVYAFGLAAMAHKTAHIFAARAIKDADTIPADYIDDGYWP